MKIFQASVPPPPLAKIQCTPERISHLTESQRASIAARVANMPRGTNQHARASANLPTHNEPLPNTLAREKVNDPPRTICYNITMRRNLQHRLDRLEGRAPGQPIELDLPADVAARAGAAKEAGTFPEALADADLEAIVAAHDRMTHV